MNDKLLKSVWTVVFTARYYYAQRGDGKL